MLVGALTIFQKLCILHRLSPLAWSPCHKRNGSWSQLWILHKCENNPGCPIVERRVLGTWWLWCQIESVTISKFIQKICDSQSLFTHIFDKYLLKTYYISDVLLNIWHLLWRKGWWVCGEENIQGSQRKEVENLSNHTLELTAHTNCYLNGHSSEFHVCLSCSLRPLSLGYAAFPSNSTH